MKRLMTYVAVVVLLILVSIGVLEYITPPPPQPPRFPAPPPVHGTSASLFWANQDYNTGRQKRRSENISGKHNEDAYLHYRAGGRA